MILAVVGVAQTVQVASSVFAAKCPHFKALFLQISEDQVKSEGVLGDFQSLEISKSEFGYSSIPLILKPHDS